MHLIYSGHKGLHFVMKRGLLTVWIAMVIRLISFWQAGG